MIPSLLLKCSCDDNGVDNDTDAPPLSCRITDAEAARLPAAVAVAGGVCGEGLVDVVGVDDTEVLPLILVELVEDDDEVEGVALFHIIVGGSSPLYLTSFNSLYASVQYNKRYQHFDEAITQVVGQGRKEGSRGRKGGAGRRLGTTNEKSTLV
jgi:hypothetical protein